MRLLGGRDGIAVPFFIMRLLSALRICFFSCIVILGGCVTHFMNAKDAGEVHTYDDLRGMFGDNIDCREMVDTKECFFHYDAFNIFNLEKRLQKIYFRIDRNNKITERKIEEIVTEYHIIPSAKLPDSFKEFE